VIFQLFLKAFYGGITGYIVSCGILRAESSKLPELEVKRRPIQDGFRPAGDLAVRFLVTSSEAQPDIGSLHRGDLRRTNEGIRIRTAVIQFQESGAGYQIR
jgi:hypothetical protein